MRFPGLAFLSLVAIVCLGVPESAAQGVSIFQGSDGTSGTITDLGNDFRIYSDSHGNSGTTPQGQKKSGSIATFGTPSPPNNLTPAPVLPFNPHGPLMPREQVAPVVPFTPSSPASPNSNWGTFGNGGSGGRFGR